MVNIIASATIIAIVVAAVAAVICGIVSGCANYLAREEAVDVKLDYWENVVARR